MCDQEAIARLRSAWRSRQLRLYLGAGVSVGSGLPTWEKLVLSMYYDRISQQKLHGWRPFANYLYAIAEWQLRHTREPLEITARHLRSWYDDGQEFLEHLRSTLYGGISGAEDGEPMELPPSDDLRRGNRTLDAVARLCEQSTESSGVNGVVTYNYDNLLEHALGFHDAFTPVWDARPLGGEQIGVFHVHGYVPPTGTGSSPDQLVFTEDQYHQTASDPYSWSNLVQLNGFCGSTGLMVGLSLSDRNIRRLLDAATRAPGQTENYALLKRPRRGSPDETTIDQIDGQAREYLDHFARSGVKSRAMEEHGAIYRPAGQKSSRPISAEKGPRYRYEIRGILEAVQSVFAERQEAVLKQLGICPIWYDDHDEIPRILARIAE